MAVLHVTAALLVAVRLTIFAEGDSVCPQIGAKNYGKDHCEVLTFLPREGGRADELTGTVWVNDGECNTNFFNVTAEDIAAVWPEADVFKKNGPRIFMTSCIGFDSMEDAMAFMSLPHRQLPKRSLAGTMYAAQAQINLTRAEVANWEELTGLGTSDGRLVNRPSVFAWEAGSRVFELVDSEGWPYIMQSMSLQVDNHLTVEGLKTLGERLTKLPEGWSYRSKVLETGLRIRGKDGITAKVLQDQFQNTYTRYDIHNGVAWWNITVAKETSTSPSVTKETSSSFTTVLLSLLPIFIFGTSMI